MPYGGTTPAEDAKIERCVTKLIAAGHDKVSAIRICKAAIHDGKERGKRKPK